MHILDVGGERDPLGPTDTTTHSVSWCTVHINCICSLLLYLQMYDNCIIASREHISCVTPIRSHDHLDSDSYNSIFQYDIVVRANLCHKIVNIGHYRNEEANSSSFVVLAINSR